MDLLRVILGSTTAVCLALVPSLLLALPTPALAQSTPFETLRLTHAEFAYGDGPAAPDDGWTTVVVPDFFNALPPSGTRTEWLRMVFDMANPPEQPLVLLADHVVLTAEFRLNGSLLNPGVRFARPGGLAGTQMQTSPHWIVLPTGLFRAGRNELLITLRGDPVTPAWLSGISIGRSDALRGEFLLRDIPQRVVPETLVVLLLASLMFSVRLWWRERRQLQGLVVMTTVLWLADLGPYLWTELPLPWRTAVALITLIWIAFHGALLHLIWRLSNGGWAWFPRALVIGSALPLAGTLVVLLVEPTGSMLGLMMLPTTGLLCLTSVQLVQWAVRERSWSAVLLTGTELLWFAGPVQLMLVGLDLVPPKPFMLEPGAGLPLFLVAMSLSAQRLVQQREQAVLQRQAAVLEERQRMMLDMHDGVGSQLVTALRLARRDDVPRTEVAQAVQDALHDLRLMIDAQDGAAQELQSLLQQWRQRHQVRLELQGPRLNWDIGVLPTPRPLSPPEALQVLRILQEALNNALQHASPSTICIALAPVPGGCELRVADDGTGIGATRSAKPGSSGGRGIDSMQRRASRLGARLDVRTDEGGGTVVSLLLPDAVQV